MSQLLEQRPFYSSSVDAPIAFEHAGPYVAAGLFTRYLKLEGARAYELSFSCGTCNFLFERLSGANQVVGSRSRSVDEALRGGIQTISDDLLQSLRPIIPSGEYVVMLEELSVQLVAPFTSADYFSHEQVELWGVDAFWGLPHYPKTEYYRTDTRFLGEGRALFEFVVPMVPKGWLEEKTWVGYSERIAQGAMPTAMAVSVLDVKQPADWNGDPDINAHWCLAHFLLDGHHKLFAASVTGRPLTLLSFLALEQSIASDQELDRVVEVLSER